VEESDLLGYAKIKQFRRERELNPTPKDPEHNNPTLTKKVMLDVKMTFLSNAHLFHCLENLKTYLPTWIESAIYVQAAYTRTVI